MNFALWWLIPILAVLVLGSVAYAWVKKKGSKAEALPAAHTARLTELPRYKVLRRRRVQAMWVLSVSLILLIVGSTLAASRPITSREEKPASTNRDIMLCLDVSGSMTRVDAEILKVFKELVKSFNGERVGMVIFDSSAVQAFPLTEDQDFLNAQLDEAISALTRNGVASSRYFSGTFTGTSGSSLIGDGLATCVSSFPGQGSESQASGAKRSRSIILATDNVLAGKPVFTLEEAQRKARDANITVYGINPRATRTQAADMQRILESNGGYYYTLGNARAAKDIVDRIQRTDEAKIDGVPRVIISDDPRLWLLVAGLGMLGMIVGVWRWRW